MDEIKPKQYASKSLLPCLLKAIQFINDEQHISAIMKFIHARSAEIHKDSERGYYLRCGMILVYEGDYVVRFGEDNHFYGIAKDKFESQFKLGTMDDLSDGYHTFGELYEYRMLYNAAFLNGLVKSGDIKVCKSKKHHDGKECFGGGWFIVVAELPTGQISNHYELKYWDLFKIPEVETAPKWDGHTPKIASDRLKAFILSK